MPPLNRFQKSCIALAVGQALIPAHNIHAATINVDPQGTEDACTLVDAVASANSDSNIGDCVGTGAFGSDTIVMPSATFTITSSYNGLSNYFGGLPVTSNITIQGNDALMVTELSGGEQARFFDVSDGGNLTLNEITLGGEGSGSLQGGEIGGDRFGGAIRVTESSLTINSSTLQNNKASYGGAIGGNDATISLNNVVMSQNGGQKYSPDQSAYGGAVFVGGEGGGSTLDINQSVFYSNAARHGGAIFAYDTSSVTITESAFLGNFSKYSGGAISAIASDVTLNSSALLLNVAASRYQSCGSGVGDSFSQQTGIGRGGAISIEGVLLAGAPGAGLSGSGVVVNQNSTLSISESSLTYNIAACRGSAISVNNGAQLNIDKSSATYNIVRSGYFYAPATQVEPTVQNGIVPGQYYGGAIVISSNAGETHAITNSTLSENISKYVQSEAIGAPTQQSSVSGSPDVASGDPYSYGVPAGILHGYGNLTLTNSTIVAGINRSSRSVTPAVTALKDSNGALQPGAIIIGPQDQAKALYAYGGETTVTLKNSVISHSLRRGENANQYLRGDGGEFNGNDGLCTFSNGATVDNQSSNNFFAGFSCAGSSDESPALLSQGSEIFDIDIGQVGDPRLARRNKYATDSTSFYAGSPSTNGSFPVSSTAIHTPLFNSPLLGAGNLNTCSTGPVGGEDQRGRLHHQANCDIGAIDAQNTVVTVNSIGGEVGSNDPVCTLNDALTIAQSNNGSKYTDSLSLRPGSTCAQSVDLTTIQFDSDVFPRNVQTTISINNELPSISGPVSIEGPGSKALTVMMAINANDRILGVNNGNLYMSGVTLTGGESFEGGAIDVDRGDIHLDKVVLTGNSATRKGGAISAGQYSNAYISNSSITNNSVTLISTSRAGGGGIFVENNSRLIMHSSTVSANTVSGGNDAAIGGGVAVYEAYAKITNSTISGNSAYNGGGISADSDLNTDYSSYYGLEQPSIISLVNTTVTGNSAINNGGGIFLDADNYGLGGRLGGYLSANASIVSGNEASLMGNEIALNKYNQVNLRRSLLGSEESSYADAVYNDSGSFSGAGGEGILATSDLSDTMPNPDSTLLGSILEPLDSNGGPTQTHALVANSPAIDALLNRCSDGIFGGFGPFASDLARDQRGFARDGSCDIGSFEYDNTVFFIIRAANGNVISFGL